MRAGVFAIVTSLMSLTAVGQTVPYAAMADAGPDQPIAIHVVGLPADAKDLVKVQFTNPSGVQTAVAATVDATNTVVQARVPADAMGPYQLTLLVKDKPVPVPGELRVRTDAGMKPKVTAVTPTTAYRNALEAGYDFEVLGENFSREPGGTELRTENGGLIARSQVDCKALREKKEPCVQIDKDDPTHKLHVYNYPARPFEGPLQLRVSVGSLISEPPLSFTLSRGTLREIRWWSLAAFGVLFLLVFLVVRRGVGTQRIGRRRYALFSLFVLDKETNTYSLSKLQLLLWTAVSVYAYIYFFLCRSVIQWQLEFPDVPEGLPSLLGVSAGTAVAAIGLQSYRGSKGTGEVHPSPADFISSGGSVVAERFQFFVWTIVGCAGFIALLWLQDPAQLQSLPKIPDNFFNLMGISAVGYLAGKAVRKPGPVIRSVVPTIRDKQLTLKVVGENIQEDAKVRIDGKEMNLQPEDLVDQHSTADASFRTSLTYETQDPDLMKGTHKIELINKDGYLAASEFTSNQPGCDANLSVPAGKTVVAAKISGHDFVDGSTVEWTPPDATTPKVLTGKDVTFVSDKELTVSLTPGETKGPGKIAVINPAGARANGMLEVK